MAGDSNPLEPPKGVDPKALDELYRGPLEEFTTGRNDWAKDLRAGGKSSAADWVKRLRKPSRAAWLINQLATSRAGEVADLLSLGSELRAAQEEMLAGSPDRARLRDTARREQQKVDSLARAAEALGREHGAGAQILTRVTETLQAAAGDPAVAAAIERGRLTREQRAASVGLIGTAAPATGGSKRGKASERSAAEQRARRQQAKRRQAAERKLASAEKRLGRERAALQRARDRVEEAERRVHGTELDAHAARRELDEF